MKSTVWSIVLVFLSIGSFVFGRGFQSYFDSRFWSIDEQNCEESNFGTVFVREEFDSIGLELFVFAYSTISFDNDGDEVTVYRSRPPSIDVSKPSISVHGVKIAGDRLKWNDGLFAYDLSMSAIDNRIDKNVPTDHTQ